MSIQETFGTKEVAAMLGIAQVTAWMTAKKRGIGVRVGRDWRFTAADVDALRRARRPYKRKAKDG